MAKYVITYKETPLNFNPKRYIHVSTLLNTLELGDKCVVFNRKTVRDIQADRHKVLAVDQVNDDGSELRLYEYRSYEETFISNTLKNLLRKHQPTVYAE